jgi:hypothetical protein
MAWQSYELDRAAQNLVLTARQRNTQSLNQAHKMRMAVAYGLERFWGEHLRLQSKEPEKSQFWKETWDTLAIVLTKAGMTLPNDPVSASNTSQIQAMSRKLWELTIEEQRIAIAVLTQLCDCIVWWTQRYKTREEDEE